MKTNLTEKDIKILKVVSQIAAGFTLIVALTMIFSLAQLKIINPLDNPVLLAVKAQYDKDPESATNAEQVRAMDLMARKAYFSSRWQVETGAYLLLAGAVVFIFCQRLLSDTEKLKPVISQDKENSVRVQKKNRKYLMISGTVILLTALSASFVLRSDLPDTFGKGGTENTGENRKKQDAPKPDKTNYPFFRGQDSRGIAGSGSYPTEWDGESGKNIAWKIELPANGKSSPVIWDNKIFLTGAEW